METCNKRNTTLRGHTNMIIALGLGKNNALTLRVRALFLPSPRAIIMFVWPLWVIFLLYVISEAEIKFSYKQIGHFPIKRFYWQTHAYHCISLIWAVFYPTGYTLIFMGLPPGTSCTFQVIANHVWEGKLVRYMA